MKKSKEYVKVKKGHGSTHGGDILQVCEEIEPGFVVLIDDGRGSKAFLGYNNVTIPTDKEVLMHSLK